VIAVAEHPELRSKNDEEVFAWACAAKQWVLTESAKDFRPILLRAWLFQSRWLALGIQDNHLRCKMTTLPLSILGHIDREICHSVYQVVMAYTKSQRLVLMWQGPAGM
jgi:hypothetical protein